MDSLTQERNASIIRRMESMEQAKYHCPIHGPHNGGKIGSQTTDKCLKCINEDRAAKVAKARGFAAKAEPDKRGQPDQKVESAPEPQRSNGKVLMIDFSDYPELLQEVKEMAAEEVRTPEQQVVYCVKKMVGNAAH